MTFSCTIWVDGDACPRPIKEVLYRVLKRLPIKLIFVANQPLRLPEIKGLSSLLVKGGFDVADDAIVDKGEDGDIVITSDIPLAARLVEKGLYVLSPRGKVYSEDNIGERLAMRNFMDQMRSSGLVTGGPSSFNERHKRAFANALDRLLTKLQNKAKKAAKRAARKAAQQRQRPSET